jgi:hypothetical protein
MELTLRKNKIRNSKRLLNFYKEKEKGITAKRSIIRFPFSADKTGNVKVSITVKAPALELHFFGWVWFSGRRLFARYNAVV